MLGERCPRLYAVRPSPGNSQSFERWNHDYRRSFAGVTGGKETLSGRHREADRAVALLHFARREWSHGSSDRDAGKIGSGSEIPLYQLFYEGEEPPKLPHLLKRKTSDDIAWGSSGKQAVFLQKLIKCLSKAGDADRKLLLAMAQKLSAGRGRRAQAAA